MSFTNDFSKAQQGGLKPEGDYEVLIVKAEEKTTKGGKVYLSLNLVIRNDVKQGYQNGYLFHTLWKRKEPTEADKQVNGYSFSQVMALGKAAGLPNGKNYESLADFLQELVKKPVLVHLVHDTYNDTERESIAWVNPTKFPEVKHVMKTKPDVNPDGYAEKPQTEYANTAAVQAAQAQGSASLPDDEDLPF